MSEKEVCWNCNGKGREECPACLEPYGEKEWDCNYCGGSGYVMCGSCGGSGEN